MTVRAHVVLGDACDERRGPAIAQTVTLQCVSNASSPEPASTTPASCGGFEIIDCVRDAGAQLRVLTLRNPRHGNDSLLQSVEVYLNGDRRARRARRLRGRVGLGGVSRSIAGAGRSATASSTEAAAATGRRAAHTVVFIALRQERTRLAFLEDCEIKPEVLVMIIRSHIEPLRSQSKIRRSEEPEIFPARVPGRPDGVGQPIRDLFRLAGLDVADEDRVVERIQPA